MPTKTKKRTIVFTSPVLTLKRRSGEIYNPKGCAYICDFGLIAIGLRVRKKFRARVSTRRSVGSKRVYLRCISDYGIRFLRWGKSKTSCDSMVFTAAGDDALKNLPITEEPKPFYVSIVRA